MSDQFDPLPRNPEKDPQWNQEPGIAIVPGSNYANYMQQFEQFPSKYGSSPGNPYTYRPFPKMLYKASRFNGTPCCMAAQPDPIEFKNPAEWDRMCQLAIRFTDSCQKIVKDEREMSIAMESGWRENPQEAVEWLIERDLAISQANAHREYEDRNMSEKAKAEVKAVQDERGGEPVPEKPEARLDKSATRNKKSGK
jgi:hypothetical protein